MQIMKILSILCIGIITNANAASFKVTPLLDYKIPSTGITYASLKELSIADFNLKPGVRINYAFSPSLVLGYEHKLQSVYDTQASIKITIKYKF